jgi:hypothetical protein
MTPRTRASQPRHGGGEWRTDRMLEIIKDIIGVLCLTGIIYAMFMLPILF